MGRSCASCSGHGCVSAIHAISVVSGTSHLQAAEWLGDTCTFSVRPQLHWLLGRTRHQQGPCAHDLCCPLGAQRMSLHGARGPDPDSVPLPQSPSVPAERQKMEARGGEPGAQCEPLGTYVGGGPSARHLGWTRGPGQRDGVGGRQALQENSSLPKPTSSLGDPQGLWVPSAVGSGSCAQAGSLSPESARAAGGKGFSQNHAR